MIIGCAFLISSCSENEDKNAGTSDLATYFNYEEPGIKTGGVRMVPVETPKGTFNVWTKRFGNNPRVKVLLLHGGPGASHDYFESFESYLPAEGIELIYYDQLGGGRSDNPADTALWNLGRFVDEVEQVRKALGLNKDNCYLLGHSWGGWLAIEYALTHQDDIKGLILSSTMSSSEDYDAYAHNVLAKQMDPAVVDSIIMMEERGDFENPHYMELLLPHFYNQFICRLPMDQWPEPMTHSFSSLNPEIYVTMQGPSEFGIAGKLEKWNRKSDLSSITVPTLCLAARYDSMDPGHMKMISETVQQGSYYMCPEGSHMAMWDDQAHYFPSLIKWITAVDAGEVKVIL